jgi:hypothetical protein
MTAAPPAGPSVDLWVEPGGTVCRLSELAEEPRFELLLLRSGDILRCRRLYSSAVAQVLAASWEAAIKDIR